MTMRKTLSLAFLFLNYLCIRLKISLVLICIFFVQTNLFSTPYLSTRLDLENGFQGDNGATFITYEEPGELHLTFSLFNDACPDSYCKPTDITDIRFPVDFLSTLQVTVKRNSQDYPVKTSWGTVSTGLYRPDKPISTKSAVRVKPKEGLIIPLTIYPSETDKRITEGKYEVLIDKKKLIPKLTTSDAKIRWTGTCIEISGMTVHINKAPKTADQLRLVRVSAGEEALDKGDTKTALQFFNDVLKEDPSDLWIHASLGRTYLKMCQYQEAIRELEIVLPYTRGEKSTITIYLASAYIAAGQNEKASKIARPDMIERLRKNMNRCEPKK